MGNVTGIGGIFIKAKNVNSSIVNYFYYYQDKFQERKINSNFIFNDFIMR